jgi:uncharacterized protein YehS (DUF1456 family)
MSNESQDLTIPPETDLSAEDLSAVQKFMDDGLPGISELKIEQVERIGELYLSGKPYIKIARDIRVPKVMVCYLSYKFNWYAQKKELMEETALHMQGRMVETKLTAKDFLMNAIHAYQKNLGDKLVKYLMSGDEDQFQKIDQRALDRYLKLVELLNRLDVKAGNEDSQPRPAVGLNLGSGVTVKKLGNDSVEITPKQKSLSEMLNKFANFRREQESGNKQSSINRSDVVDESTEQEDNDE